MDEYPHKQEQETYVCNEVILFQSDYDHPSKLKSISTKKQQRTVSNSENGTKEPKWKTDRSKPVW